MWILIRLLDSDGGGSFLFSLKAVKLQNSICVHSSCGSYQNVKPYRTFLPYHGEQWACHIGTAFCLCNKLKGSKVFFSEISSAFYYRFYSGRSTPRKQSISNVKTRGRPVGLVNYRQGRRSRPSAVGTFCHVHCPLRVLLSLSSCI